MWGFEEKNRQFENPGKRRKGEERERDKDKEPEKRCWLSPVLKTG